MKTKKSILELAEQFKAMEVKYNLFQKRTADGIYYWDILRYRVYLVVLSHYGIYENIGSYFDKALEPYWKRMVKAVRLMPLFFLNEMRFLFTLPKNRRYCFLFISRFEDEKGNPVDLLLDDIYKEFQKDAFIIELFNHPSFSPLGKNVKDRYFLHRLRMSYLLGKNRKEDWSEVSGIVNNEFQIDVQWERMFNNRLFTFRKDYIFFNRLFKKISPNFLFFQSEPKGLIAAANEQGIVTLDLQHGHTNDADMMYSYPVEISLDHVTTIPKIFLSLGEFWNHILNFPNRKITSGSNYFYVTHEEDVNVRKGILAVSTMFIHEFLKEQVAQLATHHPEIIFYYKLHSNQVHQVNESESFFQPYSNVQVIYTEKSVKKIMDHCFAVILIQSSVAYQALQKGLRAFIFKKDYYEASYDIFKEELVTLVDDWRGISAKINNAKSEGNSESTIFFEKFNPSVIHELCSKKEESKLINDL